MYFLFYKLGLMSSDYKDEARCFTEYLDRLHKAVHVYINLRMHTLNYSYLLLTTVIFFDYDLS